MNEPAQNLTLEQLEALRRLDTCTVANAIETLEVRLRNEGYMDGRVRCLIPRARSMLGYAVTVKIRCSSPPPVKAHSYLDRTDWWNYIVTIPEPRVVVVEDVDDTPGIGSLLGEVHANILLSLGCVGAVTNGTVRDLPAVEAAGFHLFGAGPSVSHAYAHIVSIGAPVEIAGLQVESGDLLHGDCHGVLKIPTAIAPQIPAIAAGIVEQERRLIALCRSRNFTVEKLRQYLANQG